MFVQKFVVRKALRGLCGAMLLSASGFSAAVQNDDQSNNLSDTSENFSVKDIDICIDCAPENQWQFALALGYGNISTPIAGEDDTFLPLIPKFSYYGRRFFIDNFNIGVKIWQNRYFNFDISGNLNRDFLHFNTASRVQKSFVPFVLRDGSEVLVEVGDYHLKKRRPSYLLGPSFRFETSHWVFRAASRKEYFGLNGGVETNAELEFRVSDENWHLHNTIGVTRLSGDLVNYYYGLSRDESPALVSTYQTGLSATNPYFKVDTYYDLNKQWHILFSARFDQLDDSITDSPIIDRNKTVSVFAGMGYVFD